MKVAIVALSLAVIVLGTTLINTLNTVSNLQGEVNALKSSDFSLRYNVNRVMGKFNMMYNSVSDAPVDHP